MRTLHRPRAAARRLRRILPASILVGVAIVLSGPGAAFAYFSAVPSAPNAGVTAATISSPTGFTATAASTTTATLSWTAPSTLTGYTLTQSPGTLAGCSATPTSSTTSCTATGLSSNTTYTWTLAAAYNNWDSTSLQARATTLAPMGATLLATATDTTSSSATTVTGITTTSGAALVILVYRQQGSANLSISSITGTAISGTPSQVTSQSVTNKTAVLAWSATGSGASGGTVTVNFQSSNNVTTAIDVVQLSGDNTASPIAASALSSGSSGTATGGSLTGVSSSDGEVFFVGLAASTAMSTPSGYAALDVPSSGVHGSWFSSSASSSGASTTLGASTAWAAIELAIAP